MKLSKFFAIICLLFAIGATTPIMAQSIGGRKREHRNQKEAVAENYLSAKEVQGMQMLLLVAAIKEDF